MSNEFEVIDVAQVPRSEEGHALVDLYIHFPYSKKYVKFLVAGDVLDDRRIEALQKHKDPRVFIKAGSMLSADSLKKNPERFNEIKRDPETFTDSTLRFKADLVKIFDFLKIDGLASPEESAATLAKMESIADNVLSEVAPDVDDLRKFLVQNSKHLMLMADSLAIASIAVMTALAHGFDSRAIFRDLSLAAILMDAPLSDLGEEKINKYYTNMNLLDQKDLELVRNHPMISAQALSTRVRSFSQTVLQLILGHHELYNGKGFPKGTRSEMLPPVARSFALAVDIFEVMKREKIQGREITMLDAIEVLREKDVDAHLRRHNQRIVSSLANFIKSNMELVGVSDEVVSHKQS